MNKAMDVMNEVLCSPWGSGCRVKVAKVGRSAELQELDGSCVKTNGTSCAHQEYLFAKELGLVIGCASSRARSSQVVANVAPRTARFSGLSYAG